MEVFKITKKEFINILANNKSVFLGSYHNLEKEPIDMIKQGINSLIIEDSDERRTVKAIKSNGLLFSNGGFLGLDQEGEKSYYKFNGNTVAQITKIDYSQDFTCGYNNIVYGFILYYIDKNNLK